MANGPPLDTMTSVMSPVKVEPAAKATPVDDVPLTEMVIVPPLTARLELLLLELSQPSHL